MKKSKPTLRVLLYDIETAPLLAYAWSIWEQNIGLNQIKHDWYVLAWAAKWLNDPASKIMQMSQKSADNVEDDTKLLRGIHKLLCKADVVITQNGKRFDQKKLNARFIQAGMKPPPNIHHIDTHEIAKRHFAFTSNKLEYLSDKLCTKYKKLKTSGFDLWAKCMKGDQAAWSQMEKYNKYDVLALEEVYHKLAPWDNRLNFSIFNPSETYVCKCGSDHGIKQGFMFTSQGKYQKYQCQKCGAWSRDRNNLRDKNKRALVRGG